MSHILTYIFHFVVLCIVLYLPGFVLERAFLKDRNVDNFRGFIRICLGISVWCILIFGLFVIQQFNQITLLGLISVWGMLGLYCARPTLQQLRQHIHHIRWRVAPVHWLFLVPPLIVLVVLFLLTISPEVSWDADTYHLTLPKLYSAHQGFRAIPFNVYSNWPFHTELLFALAMFVKDYILAKLVHFGFGLLILWGIFLGCRTFDTAKSGWFAMAFFLTNKVVLEEFQVAYIDLAFTFLLLAAFLFLHKALETGPEQSTFLFLAGICAGILCGVKLTGFLGIFALLPVFLFSSYTTGQFSSTLKKLSLFFMLPTLLLALPWSIKAAWYTGNPCYPFLYSWFGGPDWSMRLTDQFTFWQQSIGMGRSWIDYLLLPFRVMVYGGSSYQNFAGQLSVMWIILLPLTFIGGFRTPFVRRCMGVAGLYFVLWGFSSQQMRFLIPILPFLSMAAAISIVNLLKKIQETRWQQASLIGLWGLALCVLFWVLTPDLTASLQHIQAYQEHAGDLKETAIHPIYHVIDEQLPLDARLLLLNTNYGFFCEREYIADSFFEASQIADWLRAARTTDELLSLLAAKDITHILALNRHWGIEYPPPLLELMSEGQHLELIHTAEKGNQRFWLLEVNYPE